MSENETPNEENEEIEEYKAPSLNINKDVKTRLEESGKNILFGILPKLGKLWAVLLKMSNFWNTLMKIEVVIL